MKGLSEAMPFPSVVASACASVALACGLAVSPSVGFAQEQTKVHALSLVGTPKVAASFEHFAWVRPDAPRGGTVRLWARGTFDTFNPYNIKGNKAQGLGLVYEPLMQASADEAATAYCLICEWVSHPADFSSVTFKIRGSARFSDGKPVTPDDVIFSLDALKKAHPQFALYFKNVVKGEKTGDGEVTFTFDTKGNRELPFIVGELTVLPKHIWESKDAAGEPRDLGKTTLETPVGAGPYRVKSFEAGRHVVYERIADWWANDLPVAKGQWNFAEVRYEYFRDQTPAFEAFKAGALDFYQENSAKQWATAYDFEAVKRQLVVKEAVRIEGRQQMQAFAMNLRRKPFQDPRVRRALVLAYDFEWANKNLFFEQYSRVTNYFGEKGLASTGLPQGAELAILETVRSEVPPAVFTTEYKLPVNATPEDARRHLGLAARLLAEAGWQAKNGVLVNAAGETLAMEILLADPQFERVVQPYKGMLEKLGMKVSVRLVDAAQHQRREDDFDYDMMVESFPQSVSPGNEQREYWGSAAADMKGSRNKLGIKSPAVDKLIDRIIFTKDRTELEAATRALDRVLLWGDYVVPQWYSPNDRIAYWTKFGRPERLPSRGTGFLQVWWLDGAKAKALAEARKAM